MGASYDVSASVRESADDFRVLLLETITMNCTSSPLEILQRINHARADGSELHADALSVGDTNYSYKVLVGNHPEQVCVFAKVCFEYALWNPTVHYDLKRVENEHDIMKIMSSKTPDCIAFPLACWDVQHEGRRIKVLVTEWSKADEQFSTQFIEGAIDPRIAPKIAGALATLHCIDVVDPEFNEGVKPCMESMLRHMKDVARESSNSQNPKDRTEAYCAELGEKSVLKTLDACVTSYRQRDCLIHSDATVFNILVEAKPSIEHLETFGPNGTMVLCDWEMAATGPIGRDIGLTLSFPVGCKLAHSLSGNLEANESIEAFINTLIDSYCYRMEDKGKTPSALLRNIVGWCGWFHYLAFYLLQDMDSFPVKSEESKCRLRDALGVLGLKLLRLSFDTDYIDASASFEKIREEFDALREEEAARVTQR